METRIVAPSLSLSRCPKVLLEEGCGLLISVPWLLDYVLRLSLWSWLDVVYVLDLVQIRPVCVARGSVDWDAVG